MATSLDLRLPGKKGACFVLKPDHLQTNLSRIDQLRPYWNYSWGGDLLPEQPPNVEFVPMKWGSWGNEAAFEEALQKVVVPHIKSGRVKRILGFNEPDHKDQSNLSVAAAIERWPCLEKLGIPLCSPSCAQPLTNGNNHWMEDFMKEVEARKYRVDYIGVHWYGEPSAHAFQHRMQQIYERYGRRPLLVTEFAVADWSAGGKPCSANRYSAAQVLAFMKAVLPWMEAQDWIIGYCWFSFGIQSPQGTCSALFDDKGDLTPCGLYYRSVTSPGHEEL